MKVTLTYMTLYAGGQLKFHKNSANALHDGAVKYISFGFVLLPAPVSEQ